jgi:hypothetical protein
MLQRLLMAAMALLFLGGDGQVSLQEKVRQEEQQFGTPIIKVPYYTKETAPGWEERGPEFAKWNSLGVRLSNGSGTMCYYDSKENWIYVVSAGHLYSRGMKTAEQYKRSPKSAKIEVFYHNDKKLGNVKRYQGEVLCHVWQSGIYDVSLLRFHPDWDDPVVGAIAPIDYEPERGKGYHNIGCDGMREVAHYLVEFYSFRNQNGVEEILGTKNVARGGRSGGGYLTDDNLLIGITSRSDRRNYTMYSSFRQIHQFLTSQGYGFVLENSRVGLARQIPIKDRNNPQGEYPKDYIPLPMKDK